jgi:hypothetical protein
MTSTDTNGTTPADSAIDSAVDWDSLLAGAVLEDVRRPQPKPTWAGPIPDGLRTLAGKANDTGERVVIPLHGENAQNVFDQTRAMVNQIASELPEKDGNLRTANVRPVFEKTADPTVDGKLIAISFTISGKRGRKSKPATETATASGNDSPAASDSTGVTPTATPAAVPNAAPAPTAAAKPAAAKPAAKPAGKPADK